MIQDCQHLLSLSLPLHHLPCRGRVHSARPRAGGFGWTVVTEEATCAVRGAHVSHVFEQKKRSVNAESEQVLGLDRAA